MYLVGTIMATHGIKGEVKVQSETNFDRFQKGYVLYIKKENQFIEIVINSHRVHKNMDLITFNGLNNINQVIEYVGCEIYTKHDHKELDNGEFYYEDLIGLKAVDDKGQYLGEVIDIREVPQGIILEIEGEKKSFLVPFVDEFIKEISEDTIVINVIEGLI